MAARSDPEVVTLTIAARLLVNQAHRLSRSIDATVEELREFTDDITEHRRRTDGGHADG